MIKLTSEQYHILSKTILGETEILPEDISSENMGFYLGMCAISQFHKKKKNIAECCEVLYNHFEVGDD
jgi:hypothetical protein